MSKTSENEIRAGPLSLIFYLISFVKSITEPKSENCTDPGKPRCINSSFCIDILQPRMIISGNADVNSASFENMKNFEELE